MSIGFNLGLWGGLQISGIDFLNQIDSNGFLIYVSQTAANNAFIEALAWVHFGLGFLSLYWFFRILQMNKWQIKAF